MREHNTTTGIPEIAGLDIALACAGLGWEVFPVELIPGEGDKSQKKPRIREWQAGAASTDERTIRQWWAKWPDAAVGVVTGKRNDLYVLDVDDPDELAASGLSTLGGREVPTRRAGGRHIYFAGPRDKKPVRNVARNGLDFRGDGGYVVSHGMPPAGTLAPLPDDVVAWAREGRSEDGPAPALDDIISEGGRESALVSLAGSMRRRGSSHAGILAALKAENAARCVPPLPEEDLERIAGSVARYAPDERPPVVTTALLSALGKGKPHISRLKTFEDRRGRPKPLWSVEKRIPQVGVGQIYSPPYMGKSLWKKDLELSLCNPQITHWNGARINKHGAVVSVLMEGAWDDQLRTNAWLGAIKHRELGCTDKDLFTLEEEPFNLTDVSSIQLLVDDIEAQGIKDDLAAVTIDTQSLAAAGADENSNGDMNRVMSNLKQLSKFFNCPVVLVHHTGLDTSRGRGATAVYGALDWQVAIDSGSAVWKKLKPYKLPPTTCFELVELGESVYVSEVNVVARFTECEEAVLAAIAEAPGVYTKTALADEKVVSGFRAITVRGAVDKLTATGFVEVQKHKLSATARGQIAHAA